MPMHNVHKETENNRNKISNVWKQCWETILSQNPDMLEKVWMSDSDSASKIP